MFTPCFRASACCSGHNAGRHQYAEIHSVPSDFDAPSNLDDVPVVGVNYALHML